MSKDIDRPITNHPVHNGPAVGIELEFEEAGPGVFDDSLRDWNIVIDHSLRNGVEYVSNILEPKQVPDALRLAYERFTKYKLRASARCGVHVHMNISDMTYSEIMRFMMLYCILEPCIFERFARERVTNHFCVPLFANTDMIPTVQKLSSRMRQGDDIRPIVYHCSKYSAVNLKAIYTHLTIEFRHLEAKQNPVEIQRWITFLLSLRARARLYSTPEKIIEMYEEHGIERLKWGLSDPLNYVPDQDYQEAAVDLAYLLCGEEPKDCNGS